MRFRRWPPVSADKGAPGTLINLARMQQRGRGCRRRSYGN